MRSLQKKMEALFDGLAEKHGFEAVVSYNYGNCGNVLIQPPAGVGTVVQIGFMFDTSTMSLTLTHRGRPLVARKQAHRTDGYRQWYMRNDASAEIEEFLTALDGALAAEARAAKPKAPGRRVA